MSGVCPTPAERNRNTFSDSVPAKDQIQLTIPAAKYNVCGTSQNVDTVVQPRPGGSVVTNTVCCPTPGPAGPKGDSVCGKGLNYSGAWILGTEYKVYDPDNNICNDDVVRGCNGQVYICIQAHTATTTDEPGVAPEGSPPIENNWATYWKVFVAHESNSDNGDIPDLTDGETYTPCQLVRFEGCIYKPEEEVTVDMAGNPDTIPDYDLDGGFYWTLVECPDATTEDSWLSALFDGIAPWIKDVAQWGLNTLIDSLFNNDDEYNNDDIDDVPNGQEIINEVTYTPPVVDSNYKGTACVNYTTSPSLRTVVERLCDLCQIDSSDYDVSQLSNTIEVDMTLGSETSGRAVMELLSLVYNFGVIDVGQLKFIPHVPTSSLRTLTEAFDLGYSVNTDFVDNPVNVTRIQPIDLPKEINFTYQSKANAHEPFTQNVEFASFSNGTTTSINVPISLTEQEAYDIAERILTNAHIQATTYDFVTSYRNIDLEPEDIITLENVGDVRIQRIEETTDGGLLSMTAVHAGNNDYLGTSSNTAPAQPPTYNKSPLKITESKAIIMEPPVMDTIEPNKLRMMIAGHGYGEADWQGADIYYSTDGTNYVEYKTITKEATFGKTEEILGPHSNHLTWDSTNTLDITLKTNSLTNATQAEVLNGENIAMIGKEIVGFTTVSCGGSPEVCTLSGLRRGMYGTQNYMDTHSADEAFILLDDRVEHLDVMASQLNTQYSFKVVSKGSDINDATVTTFTPKGKSRRPYPVDNLDAVRACCADPYWNITWDVTNQFDNNMGYTSTVENPDMFGGFVLNIIHPTTGVNVREIHQYQTDYTYTKAQQIKDFGTVQSTIKIKIAQVDRLVGIGYPTTQTFIG